MDSAQERRPRGSGSSKRGIAAFLADRNGITALEFAFVAAPFFTLLLAVFEIFTLFFAQVTLENAAQRVGRLVRTGEVQAQQMTAQQYRQLICDQVNALLACDQRLQVDVRTFQDFNNADFTKPLDQNGNLNPNFQFNPGQSGDVVVVRAFYVWTPFTPFLGPLLSNMSGGDYLMTAAATFRNEPFAAGANAWNGN